jgi:hypothetical protein
MNELSVAFVSLFIFYFWSLKLITTFEGEIHAWDTNTETYGHLYG